MSGSVIANISLILLVLPFCTMQLH
jgi:hypothetical protein